MANGFKTFFKLFLNGRLLRNVVLRNAPYRNRTNFAYPYAPPASHSDVFIRNCIADRNSLPWVNKGMDFPSTLAGSSRSQQNSDL